jgi:hypothetical protein
MLSKERQSRSYRLLAYYLSKQIAELPLIIFNPTLFIIPVYWASNLLPDFSRFVAYLVVILLGTVTSQSFGYFFGATLLNVQKSICKYYFKYFNFIILIYNIYLINCSLSNIAVSMVFLLASMLLGGFYVKHLPVGLSWLKHLVSNRDKLYFKIVYY